MASNGSTGAGTSLPHRSVANIRTEGLSSSQRLPGTGPHTPLRPTSSTFGSPTGGPRGDEDALIIELGSRKLRLGFAGDAVPKRIAVIEPEQQRRPGDFRAWEAGYKDEWRRRAAGKSWGADHELWQLDVRGQDLALVGDKLERELRDALTKHLQIDSRPRKVTLVLPPTMPIPLLSTVLDTLFNRFQSPTVSLLSSPVMTTMAATVRSALVIDLGWHETTITAVYEYREVHSWRTVRAGKLLVEETYEFLSQIIEGRPGTGRTEEKFDHNALSFEECEEFASRMLWCKGASKKPLQADQASEGLPTLHEHDEEAEASLAPDEDYSPMTVRLSSCEPPTTIEMPFSALSEQCETTFFETRISPSCFDDHETPIHLLVYRALLQLPLDVRAMCMSRIIFTGGCSNIIGLKGRIFDEVSRLARERGWDSVVGKGVEQYKKNPKLHRNGRGTKSETEFVVATASGTVQVAEGSVPPPNPAHAPPEADPVERLIKQERNWKPNLQGTFRAVESLGPWCGASMTAQLKVPSLATIDRELWMQQGVNGASGPHEVDVKSTQRQSLGPGGLMRGQAAQPSNWTLGVWGAI